jgi:hypothetical protein
VKYELGFISQKTTFLIVTAVKTSDLTKNLEIFLGTSIRKVIPVTDHKSPKGSDIEGYKCCGKSAYRWR